MIRCGGRCGSAMRACVLLVAALGSFGVDLGHTAFLGGAHDLLHQPLLSGVRHVRTILSPEFMMFTEGQLRPLAYVLLAFVRTLAGPDQTLFWHLWLLGWHVINGLLVMALVRRLGGSPGGALLGGLAVVVHPVGALVVNDISYFHHLLGLTFLLSSLYLYLGADRQRTWSRSYGASLLLFAVGIFVSKVMFVLPFLLVLFETLYRREDGFVAVRRVAPYALVAGGGAPLFIVLAPHPLHYTYARLGTGASVFSLMSAVGAVQYYGPGLLWGHGIPLVLYDAAHKIFTPLDWHFILGSVVCLALALGACWLLRRGYGWGLGLAIVLSTMVPFSTTLFNMVEDYVAWRYLYAPVAGMGILIGGVFTLVQGVGSRWRGLAALALWGWVGLLGYSQVRLNLSSRSAVEYWRKALSLAPESQIAAAALGRAFLDQGDIQQAQAAFFGPHVKDLSEASTALCQHFTQTGDLLCAAVHLRMAVRRGSGLQFGHSEPLMAGLMQAAHAYDHAEEALGKVLTANPYDLDAMERLASIWCLKGYLRAAQRMLERVEALDPKAPQAARMRAELAARRLQGGGAVIHVTPPSPSWLRYATQGVYDKSLQGRIVAASESHPEDPVLQLEAGSCLVRERDYAGALEHFRRVCARLPASPFAWAMRCWAATELHAYDEARRAGAEALRLDSDNATVQNTLGILYGRMAEQRRDSAELHARAIDHFRRALAINPRHVSARVNLARELRHQGNVDEAIRMYRSALRLQPDLAEGYFNLGNLLADEGKYREAVRNYRKAIQYRHGYAEAYCNEGTAELQLGAYQKAVQSFTRALELRPDLAQARDALALALMGHGKYRDAAVVLKEGLRRTPGHTRGALLLASLLATCPDPSVRDPHTALTIAQRVSSALGDRNPEALLVLGDALFSVGRGEDAIRQAQQAVRLARAAGRDDLADRATRREGLYRKQMNARRKGRF